MPPEKLGRYEILRELGHGAMGVVYEATDPTIGRRVALKCIRFDGIGTTADEAARRFKNEARAAGGLNHPNLVTVYDAGEDSGSLYLAMEFIEGSNLDELLRIQRRLSPEKTIEIIRQVCAGLDFAHSKGIVHRDIKPANVMLGANGLVKITDFGIARAGEAMTLTGQVVGTPNYMSPEQVLGKTLDGRSDLFSVGVMLYEMITGERPFEGQSITTIMYKIVHETPIPPRKLDSSIHPGLSAVIEKALAKSPEERFQTGAELSTALQNYQRAQVASSASFDLPTQEIPIPAELSAKPIGTSGSRQPAAPAPASLPPPSSRPRFQLSPRARKRIVAVLIIAAVYFWTRVREHEKRVQTQRTDEKQTVAGMPAAPPAPVSPSSQTPVPPTSSQNGASAPPSISTREDASQNKSTAHLNISTEPPGANVEVDGKATGQRTPTELDLPRGEHSISLRLEGFVPATSNFHIKGGEDIDVSQQLTVAMPNINVPGMPDLSALKNLSKSMHEQGAYWQKWAAQQGPKGPKLMLNSSPPGAHIVIDGKDSNQTTPAVIPEEPGTYKVRMELDGFEPVEKNLKVKGGKPSMWNPTLKPSKTSE